MIEELVKYYDLLGDGDRKSGRERVAAILAEALQVPFLAVTRGLSDVIGSFEDPNNIDLIRHRDWMMENEYYENSLGPDGLGKLDDWERLHVKNLAAYAKGYRENLGRAMERYPYGAEIPLSYLQRRSPFGHSDQRMTHPANTEGQAQRSWKAQQAQRQTQQTMQIQQKVKSLPTWKGWAAEVGLSQRTQIRQSANLKIRDSSAGGPVVSQQWQQPSISIDQQAAPVQKPSRR
ncbi:hypothetical protein ACFWD7_58335 [Streptomyces mirabilis]|uniref:hypothetical protein n=1 Tax=Streptomyces mirabilis TaxID=68239 RepID=UPI0036A42502